VGYAITTLLLLHETLFLLLLGLPPHRLDREDAEARGARLQVIAEAVADAAEEATCGGAYQSKKCSRMWPGPAIDLGVLLVTQAYEESRLAKNVHEGRCRPFECDPVRNAYTGEVKHRARSLWQIHRIGPVEQEWHQMEGVEYDSTRAAAWAAAKILTRGYRACGTIEGAISQYAGVGRCRWQRATSRSQLFLQLRARARKLEHSNPTDAEHVAKR
jgi:hypothetical protein